MLAHVIAQAGAGTDLAKPSTWEQFGAFGLVFVVMVTLGGGVIYWLLRDRARMEADHAAQLAKVEAQRDELFNQVVQSGIRAAVLVEQVGPIVEANTSALNRVLERLRG